MDYYEKLSGFTNNHFNKFFGCFRDLCSLSMGLLFPECLFGRIYEMSEFGECFIGCCKIYSIKFIINIIFTFIIFNKELNFIEDSSDDFINYCLNNNNNCKNNFNYTEIYNNKCIINNNTQICDCLKDTVVKKCKYYENIDNNLYNLYYFILFITSVNLFINYIINGYFYGYYRTKIVKKYDIINNNRYNFYIHCIPCIHPIALCQEYNTLSRIKYYNKPVNVIRPL